MYIDPLHETTIREHIPAFYTVSVFDSLDSTNEYLKEHSQLPEGSVILADHQSKGKGRNGRSFYSPAGSGIYLSLLLKPREAIMDSLQCTAMAAVACIQAIEEVYHYTPDIKWLNDILFQDRKLAGILTEGKLVKDKPEYLILGIGINVHSYIVPDELADIVGCAEDFVSFQKSRNELVIAFLNRFYHYYQNRQDALHLAPYRKALAWIGRSVKVTDGRQTYTAVILGADEKCRLLIKKEDGALRHLSSGEISIRL